MLQVGLIGLGSEWEHRFRPALERLKKRLRVQCLYATVGNHATQAAGELQCEVAPGVMSLIERDDVRALLVLDTDWHVDIPAQFACQLGKPAFLGSRLASRLSGASLLSRQASDAGVTLMPDLGHRYTPASSRLHELIATRLGRPLDIDVVAAPPSHPGSDDASLRSAERDVLAVAIDWCTSLVGTAPAAVLPADQNGRSSAATRPHQCDVEFRRPSAGGEPARVRIQIHNEPPSTASAIGDVTGALFLQARIRCVNGVALLQPPCGVTWETNGQRISESLTSDRSDVEVMLDHFSRRVLGGLIPVPTLDDLRRAKELAEAWQPSGAE